MRSWWLHFVRPDRPGLVGTFSRDTRASVITIFAIGLPVLSVTALGAVELAEVASARTKLQTYVDAAAMTGARELGTDQSPATTERARLMADGLAEPIKFRWTVSSSAQADTSKGSMTVSQQAVRPSFFGSLLPPGGFHIAATATARANSRTPLCVLALQGSGQGVIQLGGSSALTAGSCLVQSDRDLVAGGSSVVQAGAVRTVGAATGSIAPAPLTDAPSIPDPFSGLNINVPNRCDDLTITLLGGTTTLNPGVHCGALQVLGNNTLFLNPGEHYFLGGLSLLDSSSLVGSDVAVIFKGGAANEFVGNATLSLEGRTSGPYAGFVLIADRSVTGTLALSTKNAKKLLGTIYLPNASLAVSGNNNRVADQSPWTVVVAKQIGVSGSANLVINSSYSSSNVPVPSGVGPNLALTK